MQLLHITVSLVAFNLTTQVASYVICFEGVPDWQFSHETIYNYISNDSRLK